MKIEMKDSHLEINRELYIYNDGGKFSYKNNKIHNIDGPACEYDDGDEFWRFEGDLHRKYGPARKWRNHNDRWWFEGVKYTQEDFWEKFL